MQSILKIMILLEKLTDIFGKGMKITIPETRDELLELALGGQGKDFFEVSYDVPGKGKVTEATVTRCKNGAVVNYSEPNMRRRDPDSMVIADDGETDKERYRDKYGCEFDELRDMTFEWLSKQDLIVMPFMAGGEDLGYPGPLVAPINAAFFAAGLADLQGFIPKSDIKEGLKPKAFVYVAPPFRHTHFNGKQMVVHNRLKDAYELFSYNLYPGPSAKKGVYGILLNLGEEEGWVTLHGSTVMVITPYDNIITIMHEGASGGGKSEMLEQIPREFDGRILLGKNTITSEKRYLELKETCELRPITDDMALCLPKFQNGTGRLVVRDAESGWFIRTDHITKYGSAPHFEERCIHPKEPLMFFNYDVSPGSTCLLWEHILDAPGKPCPNPRVIMPRQFIPDIVDELVEIDVRSFGVRTPPCSKDEPSYGILGLFHIIPPALAWLWRLVSPRGYANPSISCSEGMESEGVGSYWPFATGKKVHQANLLLEQILKTTNTRYILIPNQHIGIYKVGFMPQWIAREYLARRGSAKFKPQQITASRCSLLGYALESVKVDGTYLPKDMLQVQMQPEVGVEGFDEGVKILTDFFKAQLKDFIAPELHPLGKEIIQCCMDDGAVDDYIKFIPIKL